MSEDLESDRRLTPEWLLRLVREFAGGDIALDVCTEPHNPTNARKFFTFERNGLKRKWWAVADSPVSTTTVWCNPPFSRGSVKTWATKAIEEARLGCEIIFLTKDDCRTGWNRLLKSNADVRCRIERNVGFAEPDGQTPDGETIYRELVGPRWGHCLWYWGTRRRRFERVFGAIGEITHLLGPSDPEEAPKATSRPRQKRSKS